MIVDELSQSLSQLEMDDSGTSQEDGLRQYSQDIEVSYRDRLIIFTWLYGSGRYWWYWKITSDNMRFLKYITGLGWYKRLKRIDVLLNNLSGSLSIGGCGFDPRQCQTKKNLTMLICLSAKHMVLRSKSKYWFSWKQNKLSC